MKHAASTILLLASAALLASRLVSPASSAPQPRRLDVDAPDQASPALAEVNAEVDRLRDRLASVPDFSAPSRDPFSFGRAPERTRAPLPVATPAPVAEPVVVTPSLPKLVAILSAAGPDDVTGRTAVLAIGDDVQFKKSGDDVGAFRVEMVSVDALVLVERASRATFTVALH